MTRFRRPTSVSTADAVRHAWRIAWRYRARGALFFFTTVAVFIIGIAFCKRTYRSDSLLFIRVGRESVALDPTATMGQVVSVNETRETEIRSAVEMLTSRSLRERVVDSLGPSFILDPKSKEGRGDAKPASWLRSAFASVKSTGMTVLAAAGLSDPASQREKAVIQLGRCLRASVPEKTNVVAVTLEGDTPEKAQRILEIVLKHYLDEHLKAHRTAGSFQFFEEQTKKKNAELQSASEALRAAKSQYHLASVNGQRDLLEQQMKTAESRLLTVEGQLNAANERVIHLQKTIDDLPERITITKNEGLANTAADNMRQSLYNLEIQEQELLATHTEKHPKVIAVREQVQQLKSILDREAAPRENWVTGLHPTRQPLELEMMQEKSRAVAFGAELASLKKQREQLVRGMARFNEQEIQISGLQRQVDLAEASLRSYSERREQARIDQALELDRISNVNVVQQPSLAQKPAKPNKAVLLALGVFTGLVGGCGVVFLSHQFDDQFYRRDEIEEILGVPVLVSLRRNGNGHSRLPIA